MSNHRPPRSTTPDTGRELPAATPCPATLRLLAQRRSTSALALAEPGPDGQQLRELLTLAARVPDHGKLTPWRFIVLSGEDKRQFVEGLKALADHRSDSGKARAALSKMETPPLAVAVISCPADGRIPAWEQELSAGALCMNLLIAAHAMGFGANWITGWIAYDRAAGKLLGVEDDERVAGFVQLGTPTQSAKERPRPPFDELVSFWQARQ